MHQITCPFSQKNWQRQPPIFDIHQRRQVQRFSSTANQRPEATLQILMKLERGQLVIGSARWRTIEEESRNILLAIVRYRNGSIWWWFHGAMHPRSSFMAYSRIPPAVLLRFPRHLAPTLALNLPLTASLVNRPDSRPGAAHETTRTFSMDPWRSLRKYRNHWRKILVRQAMKWKIVIEVCSELWSSCKDFFAKFCSSFCFQEREIGFTCILCRFDAFI